MVSKVKRGKFWIFGTSLFNGHKFQTSPGLSCPYPCPDRPCFALPWPALLRPVLFCPALLLRSTLPHTLTGPALHCYPDRPCPALLPRPALPLSLP